jgi:hypothetical protein
LFYPLSIFHKKGEINCLKNKGIDFVCLFYTPQYLRPFHLFLLKIFQKMAKDKYHYHVKEALIKDEWDVTDDPYYIITPSLDYPVDLGAEKVIAATKGTKKIAVEIKSFLKDSIANEFHTALGQYLDYETGIEDQEPDREIYLALPVKVWQRIQKIPLLVKILVKYKVNLLIFDPELKEIVEWIKR